MEFNDLSSPSPEKANWELGSARVRVGASDLLGLPPLTKPLQSRIPESLVKAVLER